MRRREGSRERAEDLRAVRRGEVEISGNTGENEMPPVKFLQVSTRNTYFLYYCIVSLILDHIPSISYTAALIFPNPSVTFQASHVVSSFTGSFLSVFGLMISPSHSSLARSAFLNGMLQISIESCGLYMFSAVISGGS